MNIIVPAPPLILALLHQDMNAGLIAFAITTMMRHDAKPATKLFVFGRIEGK
jgi:hypothetical protein